MLAQHHGSCADLITLPSWREDSCAVIQVLTMKHHLHPWRKRVSISLIKTIKMVTFAGIEIEPAEIV